MKEIHPALSRDGLSLLFSSDAIHERLVLHERKAGRDPSIVIDDSKMGAISPDKTRIALIRDMIQPDIVLWLQLLSGGRLNGAPYALDHGPGSASMPAFSPDGQWISFSVQHQKQTDIWIVPSGGGPRTRLTNDPAFDSHASWSPDGGSIAFTSARSGRDRLWVSRVEAGAPIGPPRMVRGVELDAFFPTWAPDGRRIAFLGRIDGRFDVWIVPTDGTIPARQVTHSGDLKYLRWTRSGGLLVSGWWGSRKIALRLLNPETGESQPYLPAVEFGNDYPAQFDITPDETVVLVARKDREGNIWQLMATRNQF
jgi:WD40 repeat protein